MQLNCLTNVFEIYKQGNRNYLYMFMQVAQSILLNFVYLKNKPLTLRVKTGFGRCMMYFLFLVTMLFIISMPVIHIQKC